MKQADMIFDRRWKLSAFRTYLSVYLNYTINTTSCEERMHCFTTVLKDKKESLMCFSLDIRLRSYSDKQVRFWSYIRVLFTYSYKCM